MIIIKIKEIRSENGPEARIWTRFGHLWALDKWVGPKKTKIKTKLKLNLNT